MATVKIRTKNVIIGSANRFLCIFVFCKEKRVMDDKYSSIGNRDNLGIYRSLRLIWNLYFPTSRVATRKSGYLSVIKRSSGSRGGYMCVAPR